MCTVSWIHEDGSYRLFFNRDEKLTRRPAAPPRIDTHSGVRFIAPAAADFGGTWIAANEFGLTLCLFSGAGPARARRSRGLLITNSIDSESAEQAAERLHRAGLTQYAPFTLAALEPGHHAQITVWDGAETSILPYCEPYMPLASSSLDPAGATERRKNLLRQRYYRDPGAQGFSTMCSSIV